MTSRLFPFVLLLAVLPARAAGEKIYITSEPSGAQVQVEDHTGTTPFEADYPGGYFHEPRMLFSGHLSRPLVARLTMEGYEDKEITLTLGPREWVSNNGHKRFQYYVFGSTHFHVALTKVVDSDIEADGKDSRKTDLRRTAESTETNQAVMLERSKQAVAHLHSERLNGSGFLIAENGLLVTNKHVVADQQGVVQEPKLFADLPSRGPIEADVVYVDAAVDFALLKLKGKGYPFLKMADANAVQPGEDVLLIGNPGGGMPFSVSKGIVSAIGLFAEVGPGVWIQTDAASNPGSSGGPLLNVRGQVVGMCTLKVVRQGVSGIGFALSVSDLEGALSRYREKSGVAVMDEEKETIKPEGDSGRLIFLEPKGARILIDRKLVGTAPMTIDLNPALYSVWVIDDKLGAVYAHYVRVKKGSLMTVTPEPGALGPRD